MRCSEQLERAENERRNRDVAHGDPACALRALALTRTEVLADDRGDRGPETDTYCVEPALHTMADPKRRECARAERRDAAGEHDVDERNTTPVSAVGNPTRVMAAMVAVRAAPNLIMPRRSSATTPTRNANERVMIVAIAAPAIPSRGKRVEYRV